jgi:Na+-driven multidrug efflux pump
MLPLGVATAGCTIIGQEIGNGDVNQAKRSLKGVLIVALLCNIAQFTFLLFGLEWFYDQFDDNPNLKEIGKNLNWVVIIVCVSDFWQSSIMGILRGLGK